jgi:hypothetical protein
VSVQQPSQTRHVAIENTLCRHLGEGFNAQTILGEGFDVPVLVGENFNVLAIFGRGFNALAILGEGFNALAILSEFQRAEHLVRVKSSNPLRVNTPLSLSRTNPSAVRAYICGRAWDGS